MCTPRLSRAGLRRHAEAALARALAAACRDDHPALQRHLFEAGCSLAALEFWGGERAVRWADERVRRVVAAMGTRRPPELRVLAGGRASTTARRGSVASGAPR